MVDLNRRSLLRLGAAALVAPRVTEAMGAQFGEGLALALPDPSAVHSYEEGLDAAPVPPGDGVVAFLGTPRYSTADGVHGVMGWLCAASAHSGCLVYANPSTAASSGSVYLTPHVIAQNVAMTAVALSYDVAGTSSAAKVRLMSDGRVDILDGANLRVAVSKVLWTAEQRLRLDWQQAWDGTTISVTVRVYAGAGGEAWRPDGVLQVAFPAAAPTYVALGQVTTRRASVGFDTYREYAFAAVPPPFAPVVGGFDVHSYDEGVAGSRLLAGVNSVTSVSGSPRYATGAALHGTLGVLVPSTGTGIVRYDNPYPPAHTGSLYVRTLVRGGADSRIATIQNGAAGIQAQLKLSSRGTLCIVNPQGAVLAETTARGQLKSWARLDWQSAWDGATLVVTARYFSTDAESRDNYTEISASLPTVSTPDTLAIGSASPSWKIHLDTFRTYGSTDAWPEPFSPHDVARAPGLAAWAGDATQTSVEVSAYTNGTTTVGLLVSPNADMSAATSWPAEPPNDAGWNKWSVTGLSPGLAYYHQLTDTPVGGAPAPIAGVSTFKTLQPVGLACTTRIAVGSCGQTAPMSTAAFDDIVAWGPDRTMHLGDFGYPSDLSRDPRTHMNNWSLNCTDVGIGRIQASGCMDYIISDHDDNGTGSSNIPSYNDPITMANLSAWQQVVPARMEDTQSPPHGRWRAEVEGNVRYLKLDTRSIDRTDNTTAPTDPRSSASTMLGATQLSWLLGQIDEAAAAPQLVVVFSDSAWNGTSPGPPIPVSYCDKWPSYIYERDLISDYAAARGARLFIVFGDSHGLQQDDGANEKNGFASICCGPLDQELHMHYQDSYQWSYPDGILDQGGPYRVAQQYQRLTIAQEVGSATVTVTAEARDCSPAIEGTPLTARTMTKTYTL